MNVPLKIKLLILVLSLIFAFVTFEILLRITQPKPENLAKLEESSLFLHENKPNAEFVYGAGGEFKVDVKFNSFGFRDSEFSPYKREDVFRIAVLGDSFEEALQVELEDTWQKVLARTLSENTNFEVESYNFGVSGYGADQTWLVLREKVWQFSPDLVIYAFSPNDIGDTYKNELVELNSGAIRVRPAKEREGANFLGKLVRETYTYHYFIRLASLGGTSQRIVEKVRTKVLGFPKEDRFFLSDAQLVEGPFEIIASQQNPPQEVVESWKVVSALIVDMNEQAKKNDAQFLLTINIPGNQIIQESWAQLRDQYNLDPVTSSSDQINKELAKIAENSGINFYNPRADATAWREEKDNIHFEVDGHFNENGHIFMGGNLATFILENNLIE